VSDQELQAVAQKVLQRIFIQLEASGRHVHVTEEQAQALFGHKLTPDRPLSQPGQFLAKERVSVIGPKGRFDNVAVLGPERKEAQVEVSLTDARQLGLNPPVRASGTVENSPGVQVIGPLGSITLSQGVIAAKRHIHMTPEDAARMGLKDKQIIKLQLSTARPLIFEDVLVRVHKDYATFVHLDYDEANACGFQKGDLGRILL
jgi:propanediol utilization protein